MVQMQKPVFWFTSKLLVAVWRRWSHIRKLAWKILFHIEAIGCLAFFNCGNEVRIEVPVRIDGYGTLEIGNKVWLGWDTATKMGKGTILLQPCSSKSAVTIGTGTMLSNNVSIVAMGKISIGEHCLIGDMTQILDCDSHELEPSKRFYGMGPIKPVHIGNNVWIGSRALILKGVTIGDNSVIGAGSIVTRSIPPNSLAVGNPAKVVRTL